MASPKKNPLSFALGKFATPESRTEVVTVCHAVLSTAMIEAAAAGEDVKHFGKAIKLLEEELGNSYSAVPNLPRTHFVSSKDQIPRNNH